ncbi:MAG: lipid A deacylase LpxR family protein [Desulfosalsimonadaceae bacterium]
MMILILAMDASSALGASSCPADNHHTFSVYLENDSIAGRDNQYTNGLNLTWSRYGMKEFPDDMWLHRWFYPAIRLLGFDGPPEAEKALTVSIGQNIYTPNDLEATELVRDDRPYAGVSYITLGFHKQQDHRMHTVCLSTGIVGPHAYAEELQSFAHDVLSTQEPQGWDNQLEDELIVNAVYDYKRKLFARSLGEGMGGDLIFFTGGGIGNALTYYDAGLLGRYGWNTPDDFGNFPIQPAVCFNAERVQTGCENRKKRFGLHLFLSSGVQAVAHDIFLDGNTFRESHSVSKEPLVATCTGGIGINTGGIKTVLAFVYRTKSFKTQKDPQVYGSVNISFKY